LLTGCSTIEGQMTVPCEALRLARSSTCPITFDNYLR
jgi:hypothetical protein